MAIVLSLETSGGVCSVALHEGEELIAVVEIHREQSHAAKLAVLINEVVQLAGIGLDKVQAVAVSSGPGSYTGLRIGVSTAKGLCYALSVPLIAVGTLELMATAVSKVNVMQAWLCPMIDARRMEVYCRLSDATGNELQGVEARVIDEMSFAGELDSHHIIFFGDGAEKCTDVIKHDNAAFIHGVRPSAAHMGGMAAAKLQSGRIEDIVAFEPFYLKEFRILKALNI